MADGSIWEVGAFDLGGTGNWVPVAFDQPFDARPSVFLTIQTDNDEQAVTARVRNVDETCFEAALLAEEFLMGGAHANETIGYVAISNPNLMPPLPGIGGYVTFGARTVPYYLQGIPVDHQLTDAVGARIKTEEEQSLDPETDHAKEKVEVLTLGAQIFVQQVSDNDADTTAPRRRLGIE